MALLLSAGSAFGQSTDYAWAFEVSADSTAPFPALHSGVRTVDGPYDLDSDGRAEVIVSDYSYGGRAYVLENVGPDEWEYVYGTPPLLNTSTTGNMRTFGAGDLDGDGFGEIFWLTGCLDTSFTCTQSTDPDVPMGLVVFEHTGVDNDYGSSPAVVFQFQDNPNRWRAEQFFVKVSYLFRF